jgi:hypothetical protein
VDVLGLGVSVVVVALLLLLLRCAGGMSNGGLWVATALSLRGERKSSIAWEEALLYDSHAD